MHALHERPLKTPKFQAVLRSRVLPGDIVMSKVGTIGNACVFPDEFADAVLSTTGSCCIRPNPTVVTRHYLLYITLAFTGQ